LIYWYIGYKLFLVRYFTRIAKSNLLVVTDGVLVKVKKVKVKLFTRLSEAVFGDIFTNLYHVLL